MAAHKSSRAQRAATRPAPSCATRPRTVFSPGQGGSGWVDHPARGRRLRRGPAVRKRRRGRFLLADVARTGAADELPEERASLLQRPLDDRRVAAKAGTERQLRAAQGFPNRFEPAPVRAHLGGGLAGTEPLLAFAIGGASESNASGCSREWKSFSSTRRKLPFSASSPRRTRSEPR